jgi:uncharacterized membrane protein YkvA (DUF1232 family)
VTVELVAGIVLGLLGAWVLLVIVLFVATPRDTRLVDLLAVVPDLVRLVRDLLRDPTTPSAVRVALLGLLAWLINPIDLIPEFIPVLGPLDDVVVTILVLRYVRRRIGPAAMRARWRGSDERYGLLESVLGGRSRED